MGSSLQDSAHLMRPRQSSAVHPERPLSDRCYNNLTAGDGNMAARPAVLRPRQPAAPAGNPNKTTCKARPASPSEPGTYGFTDPCAVIARTHTAPASNAAVQTPAHVGMGTRVDILDGRVTGGMWSNVQWCVHAQPHARHAAICSTQLALCGSLLKAPLNCTHQRAYTPASPSLQHVLLSVQRIQGHAG